MIDMIGLQVDIVIGQQQVSAIVRISETGSIVHEDHMPKLLQGLYCLR